ncbi:MAG: MOSC domain-containing protein [Clostridiales bacterium]|jgi:MOSC domain-containing protein YiiM|nr:MOSC domain-containing protein [Clostridiales bacterium]
MPHIVSVNISKEKGEIKTPVKSGALIENHGVEGDAHAGPHHRQVSLLAMESIERAMAASPVELGPGSFAENLTTRGIVLHTLPVGTMLSAGECVLRISQIGKTCHGKCAIFDQAGACIMPTEGVFAEVIKGGRIEAGDLVNIS